MMSEKKSRKVQQIMDGKRKTFTTKKQPATLIAINLMSTQKLRIKKKLQLRFSICNEKKSILKKKHKKSIKIDKVNGGWWDGIFVQQEIICVDGARNDLIVSPETIKVRSTNVIQLINDNFSERNFLARQKMGNVKQLNMRQKMSYHRIGYR